MGSQWLGLRVGVARRFASVTLRKRVHASLQFILHLQLLAFRK